ncbi:MAG: ROK family protein [Aestuariivirga sp.]
MNFNRHDFAPLSANTPVAARLHNRRIIVQALRRFGSLSRAELARLTGLSPQAIANIVSALIDDGLLREAGRKKSQRGQPPIAIELAEDGGYALGIRIDATTYNVAAVSLAGDVLSQSQGGVPSEDSGVLSLVADLHADMTRQFAKKHCFGMGIVTPGPFDTTWPGVPSPGSVAVLQRHSLASELSDQLGTDVFHGNDAYAAAIGERLYGAAMDLHHFFYLYIGEGVGGGIVIGGESYRGAGGNSGEAGHLIVDPNGKPCYCGNRGCLGQYLSLEVRRKVGVEEWLGDAVPALRTAISSIENLFDPEAIVLGGTAPTSLLSNLIKKLNTPSPSVRQDHGNRIRLSNLGGTSPALGASALPLLVAAKAT